MISEDVSELPEELNCPYCASLVTIRSSLSDDEAVNLRCPNCGGVFEYIPGFGAFSLPNQGEGVRVQRGPFGPRMTSGGFSTDQTQVGGANDSACGCIVCICIAGTLIPLLFGLFILFLLP
ncbi:hypothetical protein EU538_01510 [Candidatus Thorarchaeota archaeon]|nr:MAG: hypothetical protein EU538_01510 [Candidatus Thorarchaeota archaeon]